MPLASLRQLLPFALLLLPLRVFPQMPQFRGAPLEIEERPYTISRTGKPGQARGATVVYRFDEAGRLTEEWQRMQENPGRLALSGRHVVYEYQNGHLLRSVESDDAGRERERLEYRHSPEGVLLHIKKTGTLRQFDQEIDVEHDSLGRMLRQNIRYPNSADGPHRSEWTYPNDSVRIRTNFDGSGKLLAVVRYTLHTSGDLLEMRETDGDGIQRFLARFRYRYDSTGNWVERRSRTESNFARLSDTVESIDLRRIIYRTPVPEQLDAAYLVGSWADFANGLQLDFNPDGSYLAWTNGRNKDGGAWTLDLKQQQISVTGKEHRDASVALKIAYERGILKLSKPGQPGAFSLLKLP